MADSSTHSITIEATPQAVARVITEIAAYPAWVGAVDAASVVEEIESGPDAGLARVARFHLDAGVVTDDYQLRYSYSRDDTGELTVIAWDLVSSNTQKDQHGSYTLVSSQPGITEVTYSLSVELKIPMLGLFKRKAERIIMDTALKELKKRVESDD